MSLSVGTFAEVISGFQDSGRNNPCFAYPEGPDSQSGFKYSTATEISQWTRKAAAQYVSQGLHPRKVGERPLVVALHARGTPEWAASFFAIARMGHTALTISPRLIQEYVDQLIDRSKADFLITSSATNANHNGSSNGISSKPLHGSSNGTHIPSVRTIPIITPSDLQKPLPPNTSDTTLFCSPSAISDSDTVYTVHSSGSTSCPKLLPSPNWRIVSSLRVSNEHYPPTKRRWFASAMYNTVGLRGLIQCLYADVPVFFENDNVPFTAESVVRFVQEARVGEMYVTPHTLNLLAATRDGVREMVKVEKVSVFGAVASDKVGDRLVREGVNLGVQFGMSETNMTMWSTGRPENDREEWAWMSKVPHKAKFLEMQPIEGQEGYAELVCLPGCPDVMPSVKDAEGYFRTGDVWLRHPGGKERWKIVGRRDDQLKVYVRDRQVVVNALEYENAIYANCQDTIDEAVLFGQGREKLGVLVFTSKTKGGGDDEEVKKQVFETIQRDINSKMPVGIDECMIVVIRAEREALPQTGKYNLIRSRVYAEYAKEIKAMYGTANGRS